MSSSGPSNDRHDDVAATTESRVGLDEARNLIALALSLILDKPHSEHFGPFCPVCGLVTATQTLVKEWKP